MIKSVKKGVNIVNFDCVGLKTNRRTHREPKSSRIRGRRSPFCLFLRQMTRGESNHQRSGYGL